MRAPCASSAAEAGLLLAPFPPAPHVAQGEIHMIRDSSRGHPRRRLGGRVHPTATGKAHVRAALICASMLSAAAYASPPAAPIVTVGADIKRLDFDWDAVPQSN